MLRRLLIAVLCTGLAGVALAQLRAIPVDAKRGTLSPLDPPQPMSVQIDGKRVDLAAGAQIRDGHNMIILPGMLPKANMLARYQLSQDGKLQRVWLLTPQEASQPDPKK